MINLAYSPRTNNALYQFGSQSDRKRDTEIIKDIGTLLTISIPDGLLSVHLTVDPPGAARLMRLRAGYAEKAKNARIAR